jgi:hypothetical protein
VDQPAIGRARTVAVDRGNVTEGDWCGQGAVPRYVRLYRLALGLARWAVGRCELQDGTGRQAAHHGAHGGWIDWQGQVSHVVDLMISHEEIRMI